MTSPMGSWTESRRQGCDLGYWECPDCGSGGHPYEKKRRGTLAEYELRKIKISRADYRLNNTDFAESLSEFVPDATEPA